MKKACILIGMIGGLLNFAHAQHRDKASLHKNVIYFEGASLIFASSFDLNYERKLFRTKWISMNAQTGIGWHYLFANDWVFETGAHAQLGANLILGRRNFFLEGGLAVVLSSPAFDTEHIDSDTYGNDIWAKSQLAARFEFEGGFMMKLGLMSAEKMPESFEKYENHINGIMPMISLGYAF